jgi:hypothetical protein
LYYTSEIERERERERYTRARTHTHTHTDTLHARSVLDVSIVWNSVHQCQRDLA